MIANEIRESLQLICKSLNRREVRYMLVGGVAVGFYGYQRISGGYLPDSPEIKHDFDFWYEPTTSNYYRLVKTIEDLGVDIRSLETLIFDPNKTYLRIPLEKIKLEFLPQMKGLETFEECLKNTREVVLDENQLHIIGYQDLIRNKSSVDRTVDREDIKVLESLRKKKD